MATTYKEGVRPAHPILHRFGQCRMKGRSGVGGRHIDGTPRPLRDVLWAIAERLADPDAQMTGAGLNDRAVHPVASTCFQLNPEQAQLAPRAE